MTLRLSLLDLQTIAGPVDKRFRKPGRITVLWCWDQTLHSWSGPLRRLVPAHGALPAVIVNARELNRIAENLSGDEVWLAKVPAGLFYFSDGTSGVIKKRKIERRKKSVFDPVPLWSVG